MMPDVSTAWVDEEPLPEGRVMGNWIFLPDGRLVLINGIGKGTAGYGNTSWAIGQSFGDDPVRSCVPLPSSSPGLPLTSFTLQDSLLRCQRADGLALLERHRREHRRQDVPLRRHAPPRRLGLLEWVEPQRRLRPYRNSWIQVPYRVPVRLSFSGLSNVADLLSWHSVEKFYPDYFTAARPVPTGIPATLTYGGNYFDIELSAADVGDVKNLDNTIVTLVRPGFSTHAMNMGQRFVQLYVPSLPSLTSRH